MFTGCLSFLVIGSDFKTDRAAGRLAEIGISAPGDKLTLRRERGRIGRRPAIGVYTTRGRQIGYIQPHEIDLILPGIDRAQAIFQCSEPFGAVARITLDGSRPGLRAPKPRPKLRPPPAEPRDEYCDIFPSSRRESGTPFSCSSVPGYGAEKGRKRLDINRGSPQKI